MIIMAFGYENLLLGPAGSAGTCFVLLFHVRDCRAMVGRNFGRGVVEDGGAMLFSFSLFHRFFIYAHSLPNFSRYAAHWHDFVQHTFIFSILCSRAARTTGNSIAV